MNDKLAFTTTVTVIGEDRVLTNIAMYYVVINNTAKKKINAVILIIKSSSCIILIDIKQNFVILSTSIR